MINYQLWKENIYNSIKNISDIERQKVLWLGKDPNSAASFNEDINTLYDTFCFADDLWKDEHISKFYFKNVLLNQLRVLKNMVDNYNEKSTDEEILNDPDWLKIVNQAKKIIELWNA